MSTYHGECSIVDIRDLPLKRLRRTYLHYYINRLNILTKNYVIGSLF